jgi:hypothetical protein
VVVTMGPEDAVLQIILVMKERGIVMDQVMEANMMEMLDVKDPLYVEVITVKGLVLTSMRKTTVVKSLDQVFPSPQYLQVFLN